MVVAGLLAADFTLRIGRRHGAHVFSLLPRDVKTFLLAMTAAFFLVLTRCIYRIPLMAGGVGSRLMQQEAEFTTFDGLLILLAVVLQTVVHLGVFAAATLGTTQVYELKMLVDTEDLKPGNHHPSPSVGTLSLRIGLTPTRYVF
ncbi:hypothetical protein P154DRAFT_529667 [Amniculicola lignicola CBS 123094]|uniref:RTA1 like protein n=1 Tax=Amniculicola lignicola CBS 123094 TaxID=1392246 RepID=A0A6A5WZP3_9PLEO|nr:hypothetical protein P154DRAFT_529667 [Amniculicola lignicola CBS 123094]